MPLKKQLKGPAYKLQCQAVMKPAEELSILFHPEQSLKDSIKKMLSKHLKTVQVIDKNGKFVGDVTRERLIQLLMPSIMPDDWERVPHFLSESTDDLKEAFKKVSDEKIKKFMDKDAPTVLPTAPLIEVLFPLCSQNRTIAVVDQKQKFLGIVSSATVLAVLNI